jgi:uncharacterized protein with HEPN domain
MDDRQAVYLRHMLEAAQKATDFTRGRVRGDLESDEMLSLAVVRLIEIIGEAARQVSPELRAEYPQIPWAAIAGTRNRLIHAYFDVDLDVVWSIITKDLPLLAAEIERILSQSAD